MVVQCVHEWSREKHDYLSRYIEATANPRARFIQPIGTGGAAYIDLFAGPGRARVAETGQFIDGSPLIALNHAKSPFTTVILCEQDPDSHHALEERTHAFGARVTVLPPGDCNTLIDRVVALAPQSGLNIALVDPFNVSPLAFSTIEKLARLQRMDLLLHFPTSDIKRKFGRGLMSYIDRFMGTDKWRSVVTKPEQVTKLIPLLRDRLATLGYDPEEVWSEPMKGDGHVLYHLFYASKNAKGSEIWKRIMRIGAHGQRQGGWMS
jgi:three-Cys-motif partner protein